MSFKNDSLVPVNQIEFVENYNQDDDHFYNIDE